MLDHEEKAFRQLQAIIRDSHAALDTAAASPEPSTRFDVIMSQPGKVDEHWHMNAPTPELAIAWAQKLRDSMLRGTGSENPLHATWHALSENIPSTATKG